MDGKQEQTIFEDSRGCILCGHCIAVCPQNAIIYKDMEDETLEFAANQDPADLVAYKDLFQLMRSKRSVRRYKPQKVPKELIEKVIDAMRYAPTGSNRRTMNCVVISNEETIKLLVDSIIDLKESGAMVKRLRRLRDKGIDPIFHHAPHVVILHSKNPWDTRNAAIALTYGMLSAQTLGLGSCWIGMAHGTMNDSEKIRTQIAGIQDYVLGVIALGYPAVKYYRAPPRPPFEESWLD